MKQLRDATCDGQTIVLDDRDAHYLGPNLVLARCTIELRTSARALTVTAVDFRDCVIRAKKKLTNFRWLHARFRACRFEGTLTGNDFGRWPEDLDPHGGIESCDFSAAVLDGCRFLGCDASTLRLPDWPCFTFFDPVESAARLEATAWPADVAALIATLRENPPTTAAITYWAPSVIRRFGGSEGELRAAFERATFTG